MSAGQPLPLFPLQGGDDRRHRRARPRRGRRRISPRVDLAPDFFAVSRHSRIIISSSAAIERSTLCAEIMAESRRNPEIARISAGHRSATCEVRSSTCSDRAAERGEIRRDVDFEGAVDMLMVIADGVSWRRAVDPDFDAEAVLPLISWMSHGTCCATSAARSTTAEENRHESKPHHRCRPGRRRRALDRVRPSACRTKPPKAKPRVRTERSREKLFRVAVIDAQRRAAQPQARAVRPHRGRPARSCVTARTGGVSRELNVRRGSHVKKGDVIAVLSDEAREAQVAQAQALLDAAQDRARRPSGS